mgnify:CR=1 FL=1
MINAKDEEYVESINFRFADKILKYDSVKFRKEVSVITVQVSMIQIEFNDGQLLNMQDLSKQNTSLLQL